MCSEHLNTIITFGLPCRLHEALLQVGDLQAELCETEELLRHGDREGAMRGQQAYLGHLMDEVHRRLDYASRHGGDTVYLTCLLATARNRSMEVVLEQQTM